MKNIIQSIIEQELQQKSLFFPFISDITQREKAILELRKQGKTLQEIGNKFNKLSRERVRQIEKKAKVKINFKAQIIERLAQKISRFVFTEDEIEVAFSNYLNESLLIDKESTAAIDYSKMKLLWMDFLRHLWKLKQRSESELN